MKSGVERVATGDLGEFSLIFQRYGKNRPGVCVPIDPDAWDRKPGFILVHGPGFYCGRI